MKRLKKVPALLIVIQLTLGSFTPLVPKMRAENLEDGGEAVSTTTAEETAGPEGLRFRLSEAAEQPDGRGPQAVLAPAVKLSEAEAARVLQRLPPLKTDEADEQDFALREKSLPAPRAGATVLNPFPAAEARSTPDTPGAGALEVLRYSPTGEVPLAPQVSVTFSQPMVAVTSQEEAAREVPVTLAPAPPGRWRWLGTKTILFDPADMRLPMATEFTVTVPAGTRSATGGATRAPAVWKFATPPPQLVRKHPEGGPVRRDAVIFMEFDQRVDAEAVLRKVSVRAGAQSIRVRLATADEVAKDDIVNRLAAEAVKGRWVALRALDAGGDTRLGLPQASLVSVSVGAGTPSAEGPRVTTKAQAFAFRTYGPLRVEKSQCGWQRGCTPFDPWQITFTNPLDARAFDKSLVRIEPELPGAQFQIYGNTLNVTGTKRGRTTYKVTFERALRDVFGQTLEGPATVSFNVGPAPSVLVSTGDWFMALEPSARPAYSVYSINQPSLKVSLYAVRPEDWGGFVAYMRDANNYYDPRRRQEARPTPPGRLVFSKAVPVKAQPDEMVETPIDLTPALEAGLGHAVVVVEPTVQTAETRRNREVIRTWVQVTGIGLDAFADQTELVGWATSLKDGQPLAGAELRLLPSGARAETGPDGLARLPLPASAEPTGNVLVARRGGDSALLPDLQYWGAGGMWVKRAEQDSLRWYVFDDRKMYRPGEEVSVKGWIRRVGAGKAGDVGALAGAAEVVSYVVTDSRRNEIAKGSARLNALGGFDTSFKLPPTANLGYTTIQFDAGGGAPLNSRQHHHHFQVQEFRRPEFEVTAQASEGPHFVGSHAEATVSASYFAGGGLANAEVNWNVTAIPAQYTPPNRGDFTFGKWVPWWGLRHHGGGGGATVTQTFSGRTDAAGKHRLRIDFDGVRPPQPTTVTARAGVSDVNRQVWAGSTTMLVHPSDLYVGIRSGRTFVQQGEPLVVESIVTDLDGKLITNRDFRVRATLVEWVQEKGEWKQKETRLDECQLKSAGEAVKCTFRPKQGGTYRVTATVLDDRERPNESELTLWVAGAKTPPRRGVVQESVELIPDRKEYRAGDTAEILLQSPFYPAEGVLTLRRSGLVRTERFRMSEPSHTLRIPIDEAYTPNVHVQVDLVGAATRTDEAGEANEKLPKRPAYASGTLDLSVPPLARRLQVTATPRASAVEPGAETSVSVEVRDAAGRAVQGSELAVVVVDESVLALTGYKLEDPVSVFYARREPGVSDHHLRSELVLRDPGDLDATINTRQLQDLPINARMSKNMGYIMNAPPAPMAGLVSEEAVQVTNGRAAGGGDAESIRLRENFNALAVFAPSVLTDAAGRAEVKVKVPDNLTRYRVMAVSVAGGKQFGSGESAITARMPLMVRPSAPRFLNFGDRFELPVVVQNQTDGPLSVEVAARASNAELTDGAGRRVTVPANDRVEVRLPAAASRAGVARFQVGAASGRFADAAQVELPVWTPATTEAFATYGELDKSGAAVVQPVKAPPDVFKQFGGLEVTTSSTQLQALTDAVLYLVSYPFECAEQISSRVIAVAALRDVLSAFKAKEMPPPEELKAAVARDIKRLEGLQNDDGGFAFWRRGDESWPYISIHVANALARAREKGFDVPQQALDRSKNYLRNVEQRIPRYYSRESRNSLIAYALNVRARMGERDAARARQLIATETLEKLPLEAVGWLLPVLSGDTASAAQVEAIRRHLNNRAEETAGTAHFTSGYGDDDYLLLYSSRRADGVILEGLIADQPQNDLIPKVVRGLLAHRTKGRWENTQENAFVLLALDRYFNTYEKTTPDFVARAWLGDAYAGSQEFRGRSTDRQQINIPMRQLAERGAAQQNLVISKEGAGRLYYRIGMQYAPASLKLGPADYGFTVERVYEAVDDPGDVRRDADGTWHVKAGARVRVRLSLYAPARRYHVALVDPLPAGLEALNPALAVTERVPEDRKAQAESFGWWWRRTWYDHQNLRDERAEAFTSLLWEGAHAYSYVARATTPGSFVVPPPKAEEMYHPETFGRGATDRVIVE